MKKVLTEILNLPGIIVEDYQKTEETIILSVKNNQKT
jgi:hypothetical protein